MTLTLMTLEKAFAISAFDRSRTMLGRYVNFVRIARGNAVSWRSIAAIGYQLFKQQLFRF